MGCLSHKRKNVEVRPEQKWDYITLGDFKSSSCFTPLAYGYLWVSVLISIAVYGVDTFTAVNILAFDRFFERFKDQLAFISRTTAKWIFTVCIILSFVNLFYEFIRAWRVMKRGSVAESFLDNIAVRVESLRLGKGQGWRRFLVFAELTKSKKGAEYIALFSYFSFQSWIRVIFCSGPRQAVNAIVLYSYARSEFVLTDGTVETNILSIFNKIKDIAENDPLIATTLCGMLFTLVIWVISALSLLIAFLFYIFYLWHVIPRSDGGLSGYCERKVNKRLMKIVSIKVNKAIAKEEQARMKAEIKAAKKNGEKRPEERQATLPTLMDDKLATMPEMPTLNRSDTMATLPMYESRPGTPGNTFEMGNLDQKRPIPPNRTNTTVSSAPSYSSKAPLIGGAADMGYDRSASPVPSLPDFSNFEIPARPGTSNSNRNYGPQTQSPLARMPTNASTTSFGSAYTSTSNNNMPPMPQPPQRSMTASTSNSSFSRPTPRPGMNSRPSPEPSRPPYVGGQSAYTDYSSNGRASPAPSNYSQSGNARPPRNAAAYGPSNYPQRSATGPVPPRGPQYPPQRNMTAPMPPRQQQHQQHQDYFSESDYGDVESQRGPRY